VGWFIAQSLAFIIIAALIGPRDRIWIGWLVWGRRSRGKHAAEKAEGRPPGRRVWFRHQEGDKDKAKGSAPEKDSAAEKGDAEPVPATVARVPPWHAAGSDGSDETDSTTAVAPTSMLPTPTPLRHADTADSEARLGDR